MTRKRLWKDSDGRVVNRPSKEARKVPNSSSSEIANVQAPAFPPSPPKSASDLAVSPASADVLTEQICKESTTKVSDFATNVFQYTASDDFLWDTSVQPVSESSYSTGPFDDIFAPDTASSFNMPYTTANNYNWLFDIDLNQSFDCLETLAGDPTPKVPEESCEPRTRNDPVTATKSTLRTTSNLALHQQPKSQFPTRMDAGKESNGSTIFQSPFAPEMEVELTVHRHNMLQDLKEAPMMSFYADLDLPQIDEMTHDRLLDVIEVSKPITPDGSVVSVDHPLLSLERLQAWLDLFFLRFNTVYPLIHLPTFELTTTETVLLLSMLLLGGTYADKDAHQLAVCIHDVLRPQIFSNSGFSAKPELWVLQATLLTECLGKSRAGQKQHDMSHLFHGLLINLIRRSDCQSVVPETESGSRKDLTGDWKAWAIAEQKKRLAQLCFVWDVQHAVLFSQSLCMSAFELRSTLPCDQGIWEARSAKEWQDASKLGGQRPPLLLTALKRYLTSHSGLPEELNLFGHIVLLHGLMSISWDMTRRDQTSLGLIGDKIGSGSWRDRMVKAYDNWKADFDDYTSKVRQSYSQRHSLNSNRGNRILEAFETFSAAYTALYHAAQLTLASDILDLQIYAGARHILGRPVSKVD